MTTVQPTVLTYEDADGQPLVQLVHKSITVRDAPRGSQKYQEAPEWSVEFLGRLGFQHNGGDLPRDLRPSRPDGIAATNLADATEALTRIGHALESWLASRAAADTTLVNLVGNAALYGLTPELPLDGGS